MKKQLEDVGAEADEIRTDDKSFFRYVRKTALDEEKVYLGRRKRRYEDSSSDEEEKFVESVVERHPRQERGLSNHTEVNKRHV